MSKAKDNYYLTSEQIYDEWKKWKEGGGGISERMGGYMLDLAQHVMTNKRFCRYPQDMKDEMIQESVLKIIRNLKNMKENYKGSFFAYWTRICFTAAYTYLNKHYQYINRQRERLLERLEDVQAQNPTMVNRQYIQELKRCIEQYCPDSASSELDKMKVE